MAEFSGKIVDAFYTNEEYSMVKVVYEGPNETLVPFYIEVDEDNINWQEFLAEGWDEARLLESTTEFKRAQAAAFNIEVNNAAQAIAKEMFEEVTGNKTLVKATENVMVDEVLKSIFESNEDKDTLFKIKLWALEQDFAKGISKTEKSKIRKAKRASQLFGIIDELIEKD